MFLPSDIPNMISRHFYAYTSEDLPKAEFEKRFASFQGQNSNVMVKYVPSDFIRGSTDEMATLETIFVREEQLGSNSGNATQTGFNAIVDLCGIFKRSSIYDVCSCIKKHFGPDRFHYLYHIDQTDKSYRVLCIKTGNDIPYDEELYKFLFKTYGENLRDRVFFFVDNRNVIGKDIPFQLIYQKHYGQALFTKSVVIAHDVDDFSKMWQAMGRSRTMNDTEFSIYKSDIPVSLQHNDGVARDIKTLELSRLLYVANCDRKMAGNISSIYLTIIALFNLAQRSFFYNDKIVNVFLDKMEDTITGKVSLHEDELVHHVLGNVVPAGILQHILLNKFEKSSCPAVSQERLDENKLEMLLRHVVRQKYEQRKPSGDVYDDLLLFLSGEQKSLMEISYTKQHQKQKQKQQNKNQDSDAIGVFNERHQLSIKVNAKNYFEESRGGLEDQAKSMLNLPIPVPILTLDYTLGGQQRTIDIYPTLQFIYSHHIRQEYIGSDVKAVVQSRKTFDEHYTSFIQAVSRKKAQNGNDQVKEDAVAANGTSKATKFTCHSETNFVRQNPQYTLAALEPGVYVIGMKDQFNLFDLQMQRLRQHTQYIVDDMGFVLFDRTASRSVDAFGPYFIEQYLIMEMLTKHEVAQNVIEYYLDHKETLQRGLDSYDEKQGKGFICWRFLINETAKAMAAVKVEVAASKENSVAHSEEQQHNVDDEEMESVSKKMKHDSSDDSEGC